MGYVIEQKVLKARNTNSYEQLWKVFNSLNCQEMQFKTTLKFHLTSVEVTIIKK